MLRAARIAIVLAAGLPAGASQATQEAYVWQRQPSAELTAAMQSFVPQVDGFCVLAAEVAWRDRRPAVARSRVDFAGLGGLKRPIGLALRIGPFGGPFARDDATTRALVDIARDLLAEAEAAGLRPSELQVDFDCAESKLDGYREWLGAMRTVTGPVPLVFTALPVWLEHAEFSELAHAADGFVLQVHSLEKPRHWDDAVVLCDPGRARGWAEQAAKYGVAFRVALPTYGYLLGYDRAGKFIGLAAEGPPPRWPAGTRTRMVRADAVEMAGLARSLAARPPPHCTGIIWFRLPIATDRLNWDAATFAAVVADGEIKAHLSTEINQVEPGLAEIVVVNDGNVARALPDEVSVSWPAGSRLLAGDALDGFLLDVRAGKAQAIVRAGEMPADATIAPGRRITIAWLRFAHDVSLEVSLAAPP